MRILFITPYITSYKHPAFTMNMTGLGMMVNDIASQVGAKEAVDLFAVNCIAPSVQLVNYRTISQSWVNVFLGIRFSSILDSLKFLKKYKLPFKERLRSIYQHVSVGSLSPIIKRYDIVHIHGCGAFTNEAIKLCQRNRMPFCVTLHGLVSFEKEVKLHPSLKKYEQDFLVEAYKNDYAVSFISTGNLEQAMDFIKSKTKQ